MTSLEDWLDANCGYLEMAVQDLPAKGDLPPLFAALKDGLPMVLGLDFRTLDKALAVDLFQAFLKKAGADQYAIIAAAWYVSLPHAESEAAARVIDREGTSGTYKDQRRECYQIMVGDRERSLVAVFDVERDYKGKIRRLIQKTRGAPEGLYGRMVDLLVERTMH